MSSATAPQGAAYPKLPLWDTIVDSYAAYFGNFRDVLRISWLWLLVVALVTGIASWIYWSLVAALMARINLPIPPRIQVQFPMRLQTFALGNVAFLVVIVAFVSISVAWHRRIILGEYPRFSGSNLATKALWRYWGFGLAIGLIVIASWMVINVPLLHFLVPFAAARLSIRPLMLSIFAMESAVYLALILLMLRLILLLPARAVGDLRLTWLQTWKRTRGNTWRMFWGAVACTVPPMLLPQFALRILMGSIEPNRFGVEVFTNYMAVFITISVVYAMLTSPIVIAFLSLSYRHFFQRTSDAIAPER